MAMRNADQEGQDGIPESLNRVHQTLGAPIFVLRGTRALKPSS